MAKSFIGRAFISITGDKKGLDATLSKIRAEMQAFGKDLQKIGYKFLAAGAAIQAPLTAAVYKLAQFGDTMAKGARRAGITAAAYSEFAHVAELSGTTVERFEKALQAMARGMFDAKRGTGEMKDALLAMGMRWQDLEKLSPEERFVKIANGLAAMADPSIKAAVAMKIFGKAGAELIPMLDLGAEGIAHYRKEARRLGTSIGPEMAANAERLTDMMARFKRVLTGISLTIGNILAPMFDKALVYMTNLAANIREYIENNPKIITSLQEIATWLLGIGAALVGIGTAARLLAPLVSPGGVLLALAAILAYMTGLLDPLIKKWDTTVMRFEVGGKSIRDWLGFVSDRIADVGRAIRNAFSRLSEAFGPVQKALVSNIDWLWQKIKLGFVEALDWMMARLQDFLADIGSYLAKAAEGAGLIKGRVYRELATNFMGASRGIGSGRASLRGVRNDLARDEALASETAEIDRRRAMGAAGNALGAAGRGLKVDFQFLAHMMRSTVGPLVEKILGEHGAEGGVKSFLDIFKGLGEQWKEWDKPQMPAAGPALAMATSTLGSFSGRGAAALARDPALQVQQSQLDVLKDIRDNLKHAGYFPGQEDWE